MIYFVSWDRIDFYETFQWTMENFDIGYGYCAIFFEINKMNVIKRFLRYLVQKILAAPMRSFSCFFFARVVNNPMKAKSATVRVGAQFSISYISNGSWMLRAKSASQNETPSFLVMSMFYKSFFIFYAYLGCTILCP